MKHQIMTVMLDAFLIINAPPLSSCKNAFPYFFHGAFAPLFIRSRPPWVRRRREIATIKQTEDNTLISSHAECTAVPAA